MTAFVRQIFANLEKLFIKLPQSVDFLLSDGPKCSGSAWWSFRRSAARLNCKPGKERPMATTPVSSGGADAAIAKMEAAFDAAIEKSAKITEITTEKKTELDATKQRPQN